MLRHWRMMNGWSLLTLFTRRIVELLDDDSYARFQAMLIRNPEAGDVIQGTGGLRKIRVAASGRGKRGGARVINLRQIPALPGDSFPGFVPPRPASGACMFFAGDTARLLAW